MLHGHTQLAVMDQCNIKTKMHEHMEKQEFVALIIRGKEKEAN